MSLEHQVELLIDQHGLTAVVDAICQVCYDKADHIRSSYQDSYLATAWENAGLSLVNPDEKHQAKFPS